MIGLYQEGEVTSMPCNTGQDTLDFQLTRPAEVQGAICRGQRNGKPLCRGVSGQYHAYTSSAYRRPDTCNDCRAAISAAG